MSRCFSRDDVEIVARAASSCVLGHVGERQGQEHPEHSPGAGAALHGAAPRGAGHAGHARRPHQALRASAATAAGGQGVSGSGMGGRGRPLDEVKNHTLAQLTALFGVPFRPTPGSHLESRP